MWKTSWKSATEELRAAQGAVSSCKNTSCSHRWVQSILIKTVVDRVQVKRSQNVTVKENETDLKWGYHFWNQYLINRVGTWILFVSLKHVCSYHSAKMHDWYSTNDPIFLSSLLFIVTIMRTGGFCWKEDYVRIHLWGSWKALPQVRWLVIEAGLLLCCNVSYRLPHY